MYQFEVDEFKQRGFFQTSKYQAASGYLAQLEQATGEKLIMVRGLPPYGDSIVICRPALAPKYEQELKSYIANMKQSLAKAEEGLALLVVEVNRA